VSTRGIIARNGANEGEFVGRYHHWDSNPVSLGKTLWALYHGHFKKDLGKMLATLAGGPGLMISNFLTGKPVSG